MILALWFASLAFASETEVVGYSPELNAVFASVFAVPDDGRCRSYILDLDRHARVALPPVPDVAKAVVAVGEDDERSSCALRAFDAQLELKMKTPKTASTDEKKLFEGDWSKPRAGFKDETSPSLGAWLRKARPAFATRELSAKLLDLGVAEAGDHNWLDAYDALTIATEMQPKLSSKESRDAARAVVAQAEKESGAKAGLMWEVARLLDPGAIRPKLMVAAASREPARAAGLILQALGLDSILTTRTFREAPELRALRCDPAAAITRRKLPPALVADLNCK